MELAVSSLATLAWLSVAGVLIRARRALTGTTLLGGWRWAVIGSVAWTLAWAERFLGPWAYADQLWYLAAVLMLCPALAALGARRPVCRVWDFFVVLPLILALGWSAAASAWGHRDRPDAWGLDEPVIVGFLFVLVMGGGNYLPTRYVLTALTWGAGLLCIVLPLSPWWGRGNWDAGRAWGTLLMAAAFWLAWQSKVNAEVMFEHPLGRVWSDFRHDFGLVWARRMQDRFNLMAEKERWPERLTLEGFEAAEMPIATPSPGETPSRGPTSEYTLRWLLRRFVDPEWVDARLKPDAES